MRKPAQSVNLPSKNHSSPAVSPKMRLDRRKADDKISVDFGFCLVGGYFWTRVLASNSRPPHKGWFFHGGVEKLPGLCSFSQRFRLRLGTRLNLS